MCKILIFKSTRLLPFLLPNLAIYYCGSFLSLQLRKSGGGGVEANQDMGGARQSTRRVSVSTLREVKGRIDEASVFRESGSQLIRERKIVAIAVGTNHTAMVTGQ